MKMDLKMDMDKYLKLTFLRLRSGIGCFAYTLFLLIFPPAVTFYNF
jgi:hypothetical protein